MRGVAWTLSYVVLYAATLCALAVSITTAKNYGRIARGHDDNVALEEGLPVGSSFPDIVLTAVTGEELRPTTWPSALIVQVSITDEADVPMFGTMQSVIEAAVMQRTIIVAAGRSEHFEAVQQRSHPASLVHDSSYAMQHALRTQYRPYAVMLRDGIVIAGRPITSVTDLGDFVHVCMRNMDAYRQQPRLSSDHHDTLEPAG